MLNLPAFLATAHLTTVFLRKKNICNIPKGISLRPRRIFDDDDDDHDDDDDDDDDDDVTVDRKSWKYQSYMIAREYKQ